MIIKELKDYLYKLMYKYCLMGLSEKTELISQILDKIGD